MKWFYMTITSTGLLTMHVIDTNDYIWNTVYRINLNTVLFKYIVPLHNYISVILIWQLYYLYA